VQLAKSSKRINIEPWLRQEALIAAKEAGIAESDANYLKFINKYISKWYGDNLQGKRFFNSGMDDIGFFTRIGKREGIRSKESIDTLPYAQEIIEKGKISKPVKKGHNSNSNDFESFRYITAPIEYAGKKMKGIVDIGKEKSRGVMTYGPAARDINSILKNKKLSSDNYPNVNAKSK
jgi:hypothetical protein